MRIVKDKISIEELAAMSEKMFGGLVKVVVDVELGVMVVDGHLHSDEEELLLENGSKQQNLWGINLHPAIAGDDWIEFDSMINLRPSWGNRSRGVDDVLVREKIAKIVAALVSR